MSGGPLLILTGWYDTQNRTWRQRLLLQSPREENGEGGGGLNPALEDVWAVLAESGSALSNRPWGGGREALQGRERSANPVIYSYINYSTSPLGEILYSH